METSGYLPPEGKTFVRSDMDLVRTGIISSPEKLTPVMSYTNEDLGYAQGSK